MRDCFFRPSDCCVCLRGRRVCHSWPRPAPVQPPVQHAAVSGSLSEVHCRARLTLHAAPDTSALAVCLELTALRATPHRGQASAQLHRALPRLTSHTCPAFCMAARTWPPPPPFHVHPGPTPLEGGAVGSVRVSADSSVSLCEQCRSAAVAWQCRLRIGFHERLRLGLHTGVALFSMLCDISGHAVCCIRNQVLPWCRIAWCIA